MKKQKRKALGDALRSWNFIQELIWNYGQVFKGGIKWKGFFLGALKTNFFAS